MIVEGQGETGGAEVVATGAEVSSPESSNESVIQTDKPVGLDSLKGITPKEDGEVKDAPPEYTPNYKYKAAQKELEFDELFKPLIKSKEVEEKLREIYAKGYGIESVREDRDSLKTRFAEVNEVYTEQTQRLDTLQSYIDKKDYDSLFEESGIPIQDIMQFAHMKLKLRDATPEQRQAYENSRTATRDSVRLSQENQTMQQRMAEMAQSQTARELDIVTQRPDVSATMQAFDARMGKVGAFRDEVYKRGQYHYAMSQKDIPVEQAINEVMSLIGPVQTGQPVPPQAGATSHGQPAKKAVIPNIQGRGTSPAKKVISSIADLNKRRQELEAQGG